MRFDEISQKFPADHLKAQKIGVTESVSSLWQFCVFFLFLKFGVMNFVLFYFVFFYQQAPGRAQISLTVKQI